jgi:hypothetical protein
MFQTIYRSHECKGARAILQLESEDIMCEKKFVSLCILSNAESSLLKIKLENNFKFIEMTFREGIELVCKLENISQSQAYIQLMDTNCCQLNKGTNTCQEMRFYAIANSYNYDFVMDNIEIRNKMEAERSEKILEALNDYLYPKICLMRLFKEGNITIPLTYVYISNGNKTILVQKGRSLIPTFGMLFAIEDTEINELQKFIEKTKLPFSNSIQLAFDMFNQSYGVINQNLSFLSLMICMEILFNPDDRSELRNRVSKGIAILIGKDRNNSINIYRNMKVFYDKRSSLIHSGKPITDDDLQKLRYLSRESIKQILKINEAELGKNLSKFKDRLDLCGIGEKP